MITHLDNRQIVIKSNPGEIIKPIADQGKYPFMKIVPDEGMPSRGNPFVKGNLYILFRVKFPSDGDLDLSTIEKLREILPEPDDELMYDEHDVEEVNLGPGDVTKFGSGGASSHDSAYDSDDDNAGANPGCQQA